MEPILKLNRAGLSPLMRLLAAALFVLVSVGLLRQRLVAIYDRPYALPAPLLKSPPRREDMLLFERSLAAGLLRVQADGRIAVAPADLSLRQIYASAHPELLTPHVGEPDWLGMGWNEDIAQIHRALQFPAPGLWVREEVGLLNPRLLLASLRWRTGSDLAGEWRADWAGAPLALVDTVPPVLDRWFAESTRDWQPWRWVARWPALEGEQPVRMRLKWAVPLAGVVLLEVLVVGKGVTVTGAQVLSTESHCLQSRSCDGAAVARWLRLEVPAKATQLEIGFLPLPATVLSGLLYPGFTHIQWEDGRLIWRTQPSGITTVGAARPPAPMTTDEE